MNALLTGLAAFAAFAVVHIVLWRRHRPRAEYAALGGLWLAVLVGAMVLVPLPAVDLVNVLMLYTALALPYFTTYSAVQADSPSMTILLRIERAGAAGVGPRELSQELGDEQLVLPRLADLLKGGLASCREGRYVIQPRGAAMARVHTGFRALLRMEKGG